VKKQINQKTCSRLATLLPGLQHGLPLKIMTGCFLFMAVLLTACKKTDPPLPQVDCSRPTKNRALCNQLIAGQWQWVYERYFSRRLGQYQIFTPATKGYTRTMILDKNNNATFYKNGVYESDARYEVADYSKITNYPADTGITTLIFYDKRTGYHVDHAPLRMCTDSLFLNYQFYSDTKGWDVWVRAK
jgi:hypothetical protein